MNALSTSAWTPQLRAGSDAAPFFQSSSGGGARLNARAEQLSSSSISKAALGLMDLSYIPRGHKNLGSMAEQRRMPSKPQALLSGPSSGIVKERVFGQLSFWNSNALGSGRGMTLQNTGGISMRSASHKLANGSQLALSHAGYLSERIASSQFCSSSTSAVCWKQGRRQVQEGVDGRFHFLERCSQRRVRRKVAAGMSADSLRQMSFRGCELYNRWSERRIQRAPPIAVGRGPPQPASENFDLGEYTFEHNTGMDDYGDVSFGDEAVADDVELSSDLSAAHLAHGDTDDSSDARHAESEESREMNEEESESLLPWQNWISKRWGIVMLCFFAFLLCNMDRVNMSIAILPMSAEYHWNPTTAGLVQSSFFWGYLLTQVAGGIWADSIGGKQVLGFGVIWWSLATMATPIAAKLGLPVLFFVRACMGIGEGVAMPAMNNLLSKWIPVGERSRSLALVYSGMYLGSVIGLACSPSLIQRFGWPSVFFSFGSVGALWFFVWERYAQSSPGEDPTLSDTERELILRTNKPKEPIKSIPWRLLLSKAPVWALIVCHFCHNWGTFILLTWMPTYYNQVLGFNLMESGMFSVLPWLTMAISANVGGYIADTLVSKGVSVTTVRKVMQSIGFLGPAFFLTQLSHVKEPHLAVLCMMASQGTDAFSQSGLYSNHQDIGPRYSGVLLGLSNTAGVLAGVVGTAATGYILQHGTWDDVFKVAVGLYLFGTVVWNLFSTGEQLFD